MTDTVVAEAQSRSALARDAEAEAEAAHEAAQAKADELRNRLRAGDHTVTAASIGRADSEVERCELLLSAATVAVEEARAEEAKIVQRHVSEELAANLAGHNAENLRAARAEARRSIVAALHDAAATSSAPYRETLQEYKDGFDRAHALAKSAGLVVGAADPMSPVLVDGRDILVDGARRSNIDVQARVNAVATDAFAAVLGGAR